MHLRSSHPLDIPAPRTLCSHLEFTALSRCAFKFCSDARCPHSLFLRLSPVLSSSSSRQTVSVVSCPSSSLLLVWAPCSSSLVLSSRPTLPLNSSLAQPSSLLPHQRGWPSCCTSTCASTPWDGDHSLGSMSPISSPPAPGITVLPSPARPSGYSVRLKFCLFLPIC